MSYLSRVVSEQAFRTATTTIAAQLPEAENIMKTAAEVWLEQGEARGLQKGLQKGLDEGLQKGMDRGLQKGLDEGLQKGMDRGRSDALLLVLESRGLVPTEEQRQRIAAGSAEQMDRWLRRAVFATTVDELLE